MTFRKRRLAVDKYSAPDPPGHMTSVAQTIAAVRERIARAERAAGRPPGSVGLLAVSKTHPVETLREAAATGQRAFGENYLQDALPKMDALADLELEWHFIGPLQSNKTRQVAARFHWVHALDRLKIARRLSEQRGALAPLSVCIQVNLSREATKSGVSEDEVGPLAREVAALPGLRLRGLMTIPRPESDFERQRAPYRRLRELYEGLRAEGLALDTLSMGMSADLEAAVAEGATLVRVGTAVFGPRRTGPLSVPSPPG